MDNTGFTICIGLVAATATATATTAYAFAITLREYRAELARLRNTVGAMLETHASYRDRIQQLERQAQGSDWLIERMKAGCTEAPDVGRTGDGTQQDTKAPWL